MTSGKLLGSKRSFISLFISVLAFVLVFCFETILNLRIKTMQNLPSDFENLYWGARLAGFNWQLEVNPSSFSLLQSLIYTLLFKLVHRGPLFMWQAFLLVGVFCRSIPAFVATHISSRVYNLKSFEAVMLGVLVAIAIPIRATSLSRQAFIVGIMWMLIYFLVNCISRSKSSDRMVFIIICSIVTGLLVALDFTLIYIFLIEALFFAVCSNSKKFRELIVFGITSLIVIVVVFFIYQGACTKLGINLSDLVTNSFKIGTDKLKYLPTLFVASFWESTIYSCGALAFIVVYALFSVFGKKTNARNNEYFILDKLTCFLVAVSIIQMVIDSIQLLSTITIEEGEVLLPSPTLFDISRLSFIVAPIIFLMIVHKQNKTKADRSVFLAFLGLFGIAVLYVFCSLIIPASLNEINTTLNYWGANQSAFLYTFDTNSLGATGLMTFLIYLVIAVICYFTVSSSRKDEAVIILTAIFVFQYFSGWIYNDGALKDNGYFDWINGTNRFMTLYPDIFEGFDEMNFAGDYYSMAMLQFALKDTSLILELPDSSCDEYVIFSQYPPDLLNCFMNLNGSKYTITDMDNMDEYIYIKGDKYFSLFDKPDIMLIDFQ